MAKYDLLKAAAKKKTDSSKQQNTSGSFTSTTKTDSGKSTSGNINASSKQTSRNTSGTVRTSSNTSGKIPTNSTYWQAEQQNKNQQQTQKEKKNVTVKSEPKTTVKRIEPKIDKEKAQRESRYQKLVSKNREKELNKAANVDNTYAQASAILRGEDPRKVSNWQIRQDQERANAQAALAQKDIDKARKQIDSNVVSKAVSDTGLATLGGLTSGIGGQMRAASNVVQGIGGLIGDKDMIEAYDRAFFFEGGGKSAFYIYGGFKIWEYSYDEVAGYKWQTVEPYIPCVNISVDARHESGTSYEAINMLSDYVAETFQNNVYSTVTGHSATGSISGATITVDETLFLAMLPNQGSYVFTYTEADHTWLLSGDQVSISNYGISLSASPANNDTITVAVQSSMRINLPKRVLSITDMKVFASTDTAYDTELILQATKTYTSANYVTLIIPQDVGNSYLEFYQEYLPLVDGEDAIKVIYPRNAVTSTTNTTGEITISVGA